MTPRRISEREAQYAWDTREDPTLAGYGTDDDDDEDDFDDEED